MTYNAGMRAVKSVLVMAGSLKRQNPDKPEDVVLIRALRDSNLPKFLVDDAGLFQVSTAPTYICSHLLHNCMKSVSRDMDQFSPNE